MEAFGDVNKEGGTVRARSVPLECSVHSFLLAILPLSRNPPMSSRLIVRVTAPVVAISLLLLAVGIGAAWQVQRWQKRVSQDLRVNVSGMRAGEELEIL